MPKYAVRRMSGDRAGRHSPGMDLADLLRRLADATERRRNAIRGSREWVAAQLEIDGISRRIWRSEEAEAGGQRRERRGGPAI
jgi:hypothetical protein